MLFVTFVVLFIGGPLAFRQLLRMNFAQGRLGFIAVLCTLTAIAIRYWFLGAWDNNFRVTVVFLLLIWMAWIVVLALGTQALRLGNSGPDMLRWSSIIGAAGTTVPWFGLAFAKWIEG